MKSLSKVSAGVRPAVQQFAELPDDALLQDWDVAALLRVHRATIWRYCEQGLLPAPVKRGRTTRWRVGGIRRFLREGIDASRPAEGSLTEGEKQIAAQVLARLGYAPLPELTSAEVMA